jgi:hypothetical protein
MIVIGSVLGYRDNIKKTDCVKMGDGSSQSRFEKCGGNGEKYGKGCPRVFDR